MAKIIGEYTKTVHIVVYTYSGTEVREAIVVDKHTIAVMGDRPVKHLVTATLDNLKDLGVLEGPCCWINLKRKQ